ncbi:hypothetical protein DL96DRAFT_1816691 [Flagelloscypha sp. PMI_526]|nr:hypothetical protein DL96DRAFT_1816691 [Flagelloscypha sp. PMI_526]
MITPVALGSRWVTPEGYDITDATGRMFVANIENTFLYGTLVLQGYYYWTQLRAKDKLAVQFIALVPILFEGVQTVFVIYDGYELLCNQWGVNPEAVFDAGYLWLYVPVMGALTGFWVQGFFAWRLYMLTRKIWVGTVVIILALVRLVASLVCGAVGFPLKDVRQFGAAEKVVADVQVWLSSTLACDLAIMSLMVYFLTRSRTGFKSTDSLIWRIITLTVQTGGFCSLLTLVHLVFYYAFPNHSWHLAISVIEGKAYANALLVLLNSRAELANLNNTDEQQSLSMLHATTSANHNSISAEVSKNTLTENLTATNGRAYLTASASLEVSFHRHLTLELGSSRLNSRW